ncbi:RNA-directed DNA polymerase, eukaryota, reverse transcriptase zinc-binding domain protein, partial [Tanacetum coccineum]
GGGFRGVAAEVVAAETEGGGDDVGGGVIGVVMMLLWGSDDEDGGDVVSVDDGGDEVVTVIWRFQSYPNALWVQVVKAVHGKDGDQPLKFRFPRLFALETNNLISVAERKRQGIGLASFRRHPGGSVESTQWEEMLELLNTVNLSSMTDRWAWMLHGMGSFTVSSARVFIDNKYLITGGEPTSWCNLIPIKINVMAWRLSLDKLPTRLNLDARGIDVPTVLCPICGEHSEHGSNLRLSDRDRKQQDDFDSCLRLDCSMVGSGCSEIKSVYSMVGLVFQYPDEEDAKTKFSSLILLLMVACVGS